VEATALKRPQAYRSAKADPPTDLTLDVVSDPISDTCSSEQHERHTCVGTDLSGLIYAERKKKISRDKRIAHYEEVMALHREGLGQRAIARQLRMSRKTVQRYISSPGFPERAESVFRRTARKSKLDPFLSYLREQWNAGIHNCSRLFALVKERGYTGCQSGLRKRLAEWRAELPPRRWRGPPPKPRLFVQKGQRRLSARSASFLMIVPPDTLTAKQQQQLEHICQ